MANDIVVRVGAVLDRSFDVVMGEVQAKADRAQRASARRAGGGAGGGDMYGPGRREFAKSMAYNEALQRASERKQVAEHDKAEKQKTAATNREARRRAAAEAALQRQRSSAMLSQHNAEERAVARHENALARARVIAARKADREMLVNSRRSEREIDRFATRTSHRATRFFFPPPEGAIGVARRIAGDIARGAGVDFSVAGGMSKARDRSSAAVALSNQGWNPDEKKFEDRISADALRQEAKKQAFRLGLKGEDEVMSAMSKFTDVTGDLETAKTIIGDIGLLARASGTDLSAAASAAADISAQLPDEMKGVERQKTMSMLMNVAAMQGKRGAVEIKDLARYVPRIAAQAGAFGAPAQDTIVQLLAATQIARRYGGAGNAAQAATATAAMVNTLKTPARVGQFRAQFKAAGLTGEHADIYDQKTGQLRPIQEIIKDSIVAASASKDPQIAFKKMWGNVMGAKGPEGLRNVYQKAGGGQAGLDAIDAEFKKFTAALDPEAQAKMLGAITNTTEAKVNRFQQKLDEVSESLGNRLFPTLERLAPYVLQAADGFAKVVSWAADNPGKAITAAIVASIARAGLESGVRLLLDRMATAVMGGGGSALGNAAGGALGAAGRGGLLSGGMFGGGTAGSIAGGVGVAGILIGTGVAAAAATTALLQLADAAADASHKTGTDASNQTYFDFASEYSNAKTAEEREAAVRKAKFNAQQAFENGSVFDRQKGDVRDNTLRAIEETRVRYDEQRNRGTDQQQYQQSTGQSTMASDIAIVVAKELTGIMGKTLTVRVANTDEFPKPGGDSSTPVIDPNLRF